MIEGERKSFRRLKKKSGRANLKRVTGTFSLLDEKTNVVSLTIGDTSLVNITVITDFWKNYT